MNHSYRVIWNVVTSTWQAVAETAKGRGKSKSVAQGVAAATLLLAGAAASAAGPLPTGGNIVAGSGAISQSGSTMTINQSTAKMAVNWDSFSVAQGNTVNFVQPSASAVALNRVLGSDVSVIQGAINANGQVFLLNPNGVLFSPTAQVNVGALMASTLNMSTQDFMNGNYKLTGDSSNAVINQGNITAVGDAGKGGAIALIAAKVINEGNLTANSGNVLLGAGSEVVLDLGGPVKLQVTQGAIDALVQNSGAIQANGGLIYLTAQAVNTLTAATINNTGVIRAQTLATGEKGEIRLMADMATGTANVGGTLDASAPNGGDGGFIETSGAVVNVAPEVKLNTLAPMGKTGNWLLDPDVIEIVSTGGTSLPITAASGTSQISTSTLNTALLSSNVDLQANNYIDFRTSFSYSGNRDAVLGLYAPVVQLGGDISTATNKLGLNFGGVYSSINYAGNVYVYGGDRTITTKGGDVTFNGDVGANYDSVLSRNYNLTVNAKSALGSGAITHNAAVTGTFNVTQQQTGDLLFSLGGLNNNYVVFDFAAGKVFLYDDATKNVSLTSGASTTYPVTMTVGTKTVAGIITMPAGTYDLQAGASASILITFSDNTTQTLSTGTGANSGKLTLASPLTNIKSIEYIGANSSQSDYLFAGVTYLTTGAAGKVNNLIERGSTVTLAPSAIVAVNGNIDIEATRFVNNSGSTSALVAGTDPNEYWRVWSLNTDPYNASTGDSVGLNYTFKQYGATYGVTIPAESGSGYLLSYTPTATLGLTGSITRPYDGTRTANLTSSNFTVASGEVGHDTVTINTASLPSSGLFDTKDVGTNKTVTANTASATVSATELVGGNTVHVYGYLVGSTAEGVGAITKAPLGIDVTGTYNGTTSFTSSNSTITTAGLVSGETVTGVTVNDANVDVVNGNSNYVTTATGTGGFNIGNYSLYTVSSAVARNVSLSGSDITNTNNTATITPAPLGIAAAPTYNGTTSFTASTGVANNATGNVSTGGTVTVSGLVNGQTLTGFTLDDKDVADATKVAGVTIGNSIDARNYVINGSAYGAANSVVAGTTSTTGGVTSTANSTNVAAIAKAPLGIAVTGVYNGTTSFTSSNSTITTAGQMSGEAVTGVTVNNANVDAVNGTSNYVTTATGTGGFNIGNYSLYTVSSAVARNVSLSGSDITNTNNTATITPAPLGIAAAPTYNGTTSFTASTGVANNATGNVSTGGTVTVSGLVNGQTLTGFTLDDKDVADATKVAGVTIGNSIDARNYVINGSAYGAANSVVAGTTSTTGGVTSTANSTNVAAIAKAPLGIAVTGVYNGTTSFTSSNSTITTAGQMSGEAVTGVTVNNANVDAVNGTSNYVTTATGTGGFNIGNYSLYTVSSAVARNVSLSGSDITNINNTATITPAPLGILVQGLDNGGNVYTDGVNSTTISSSGLVGQDVGKRVRTATLNTATVTDSSYVSTITSLDFNVNNYVLLGAKSLGSTGACVTDVCSGTSSGGINAGGTNRVMLTSPQPLQPPPAAPIIVPAFPDNGIKAIANDTRPPEFGGMNYVAALFEGATPTVAPTASGQTQGSAPTASTAPTEGGAMNYVSISSKVTEGGQELQVRLPEDKNRKPQSELNVNNTTVSSNSSPLDVFVVDTGINLSNLNNGK